MPINFSWMQLKTPSVKTLRKSRQNHFWVVFLSAHGLQLLATLLPSGCFATGDASVGSAPGGAGRAAGTQWAEPGRLPQFPGHRAATTTDSVSGVHGEKPQSRLILGNLPTHVSFSGQ